MTFITSRPSLFDLAIITTGECSTQRSPIWCSLSLFFFFFFLMNSSLHQWAAEISTKQSKNLLAAVEGSMYVYTVRLYLLHKYENMCWRVHMLSLLPQDRASLCSLVNSCFSPEAKQLWISPKATNDLSMCVTVFLCVCLRAHNRCIFCYCESYRLLCQMKGNTVIHPRQKLRTEQRPPRLRPAVYRPHET